MTWRCWLTLGQQYDTGVSSCIAILNTAHPESAGAAYRLSNPVIGASLTAPMASDEKRVAIDPDQAPTYARLHATHHISPREILSDGITALLS